MCTTTLVKNTLVDGGRWRRGGEHPRYTPDASSSSYPRLVLQRKLAAVETATATAFRRLSVTKVRRHLFPPLSLSPILTHVSPALSLSPLLTHVSPSLSLSPVLTHVSPSLSLSPVLTHVRSTLSTILVFNLDRCKYFYWAPAWSVLALILN